jgi:hypothetical protein
MIREVYNFNRVFADPAASNSAIVPASLNPLFSFTCNGGFFPPHVAIPSNWIIDWRRFFQLGDLNLVNPARGFDTWIVPELHQLPFIAPPDIASLPARSLLRGSRVGLPTGQDVAQAMGVAPLTRLSPVGP